MMSRPRTTRVVVEIATVIIICTLLWIYGHFDPAINIFPRCIFKVVTGLDCPGCGSQRAVHALLHGDIAAAARFNLLFLIEIPLLGAIIAGWFLRETYPRFHRVVSSKPFIYTILGAIIVWTIVRNIFFPL